MKDAFSKLHPFVNLMFFVAVIGFSMFLMNPVCLVLSLICSFANAVYLNGAKTVRLSLVYLIPMIIFISVVTPVFSHQGVTILTYFPWDNPLTLESILYAAATSVLLATAVLWFSSFNTVMTTDKFVYLFGKIIPALSLVLSMSLRFVPKFTRQFKTVRASQKCVGRDITDGNFFVKIKNGVKIFSIMLTWCLENAIETADSMKSRGFGTTKRTAFSLFEFKTRDAVCLSFIVLTAGGVLLFNIFGVTQFCYYPSIKGDVLSINALICYTLYTALMLMPITINMREGIKWKRLRSAI